MIRPDICLPVVSSLRDAIAEEVKTYAALPVQAVDSERQKADCDTSYGSRRRRGKRKPFRL